MKWEEIAKEIQSLDIKKKEEKDAILTINKDCSTFLQGIHYGQKLLRGYKRSVSLIQKMKPRNDRVPRDMPEDLHKLLDMEFKKRFGFKARSEALFCGTNSNVTDEYGPTHYVFPIGDFKMVWSDEIDDIYTYLLDMDIVRWGRWKDGKKQPNTSNMKTDEKKTEVYRALSTYRHIVNNAEMALYGSHEVMVHCKEYYLVKEPFVRRNYSAIFAQTKGAPRIDLDY